MSHRKERSGMILEGIFDGKISPIEQIKPSDPEYCKIIQRVDELVAAFQQRMHEAEYDQLVELCNCFASTASYENEAYFEYGFTMGMLLMKEVYEFPRFPF
jgi:hypothetical protein